MKLAYKTRGKSSPQGKQKVYFSAHPDDYSYFLELISHEILQRQNCVVYYDEEPGSEYDPEELRTLLSEMNLFVIPVTNNYLYNSNCVREVELPLATELHIPVLPLLEEPNIVESFNKICGDYQVLSRFFNDPTAIPYEDRMTQFIRTVLVSDSLSEKVRAAFDAYVFLSYRKKDRKYAQELMRLIHDNPLCRDIAIWYDEFLVPGENFNDAITDALNKSNIFALAVTPNLLENPNYVMTVEYPAAVENNKTIVAAELLPTDREKLEIAYRNIPECTDKTRVSSELIDKLRGIALSDNDDDPRHSFFIGLAYMNGIDVEINYDLALQLIQGAAEKGLPEALKRMVDIYRTGTGVQIDYKKAVQWQEKYISCLKKLYEEGNIDHFRYYYALEDLIDQKRSINLITDRSQLISECKRIAQKSGDKKLIAKSLCSWGEYFDQYDVQAYYQKAIKTVNAIGDNEINPDERSFLLTDIYSRLADFYYYDDELELARNTWQKVLEQYIILNNNNETYRTKSYLSDAYDRLGNICIEMEDTDAAYGYFTKQIDIQRDICTEFKTNESYVKLATSLKNMAMWHIEASEKYEDDYCRVAVELGAAEYFYDKAIKLFEQAVKDVPTATNLFRLAVAYGNRANLDISIAANEGKKGHDPNLQFLKKQYEVMSQINDSYPTVYIDAMTNDRVSQGYKLENLASRIKRLEELSET